MKLELDQEIIQAFLMEEGLQWATSLVTALAVFVLGRWLAKALTGIARRMMAKAKLDVTLISFLTNVIYGLLFTFVAIASLNQLGVETTSLAAAIAAAGLAIGLALQGSLSNLAAGVMIITFRPFRRGDMVEVAGTAGVVDSVSIFTTSLHSPDNKLIIIPNGSIISSNIINYTAMPTRRIDLVFGVGYNDDLRHVRSIIESVLADESRILKDPEPIVAVSELAANSVNFIVRPWVKSDDYWLVRHDLTEAMKLRFDAEGISIPYAQQDIYIHQVEDKKKKSA